MSVEPIITVAAVTRLQKEFGWRGLNLGLETQKKGNGRNFAFDAVGYGPSIPDDEYLLCEVKKTKAELGRLDRLLKKFLGEGRNNEAGLKRDEVNAFRKLDHIRKSGAVILWLVGPEGCERICRIDRSSKSLRLLPSNIDDLAATI